MAKKFFYGCTGLLMLVLAYHFGAGNATAQAPGNPIVGITNTQGTPNWVTAIAANGDVYGTNTLTSWTYQGNVFAGSAPTQVHQESFGAVKARYR